jgi:drug/metabolite transporter (DMT)-like permease
MSGLFSTGAGFAVLAAFGFSFKAIFIKLAYPFGVSAVTLLALRMLFSLPAFLWVGLREGKTAKPLGRLEKGALLLLGLIGYYGASLFDFIGLQYISAALERLILFTYPMLTLLFGVWFQGHKTSSRQVGAIVLTYLGIALAVAHDLEVSTDFTAVLIGGGFVFLSAVCYAAYTAGAAPMIERLGSARFAALAMMVSTAGTLTHFLIAEPLSSLIQPWQVYALAAGMALFSTVMPVFMQSAAIKRMGSARAALMSTLGPPLTIIFGALILAEPMSVQQALGAALVVSGVVWVGRKPGA